MLSSFRLKFILILAAAVIVFVFAPRETKPKPVADTVRVPLSSLNNTISRVETAIREHSLEIETITGFILSKNPNLSYSSALRIACALKYASSKYGVPIDLVVGVAYTESYFNPRARSGYGAAGLMQVVWRVHGDLLNSYGIMYEHLLTEPEWGAVAGCIMLSRYIADSENLVLALGKYYGGDGNIYWLKISRAMRAYREFKVIFRGEYYE